jgi:hypothetical protein
MNVNLQKLRTGDRLVRTKGGLLTKHHAVYAGFHSGQHIVAENQRGHGVRYISLNQFLSEGKLERVEYNNFDYWTQERIIQRINNLLHKEYDLFMYNCEAFANHVLHGKATSKQVRNGIGIGIVGLLAYLILR